MWCNSERKVIIWNNTRVSICLPIHLYNRELLNFTLAIFFHSTALSTLRKKCKWSNHVHEGRLYKQISLPPLKPCQRQTVQLMLKEGEVGYDFAWTTLACLITDKINGWKIQLDFKAKSWILKPDLYKAIIAANNISMPNTDTYL